MKKIRSDGIKDPREYFKKNTQAAWNMLARVKVLQVNKSTLKQFGTSKEEEILDKVDKFFGPNMIDIFIDGLCAIWNKQKAFRYGI